MNHQELIRLLTPAYGVGEARAIVRLVMEERFGLSQTDLLLGKDTTLSADERNDFEKIAQRLIAGEPVQYVLGYADFCGHRFSVSPAVLIPRPETEELVRAVLDSSTLNAKRSPLNSPLGFAASLSEEPSPLRSALPLCSAKNPHRSPLNPHPSTLNAQRSARLCRFAQRRTLNPQPSARLCRFAQRRTLNAKILDLCTGSGCIAVSLALALPEAEVIGIDISDEALEVARLNAKNLQADNVRFFRADVLADSLDFAGPADVIVSNPPYVMQAEALQMASHVLEHEPHLALFVPDDDALRFYRAIADAGRRLLRPGGMIAVEINSALPEETAAVFKNAGFIDSEVLNDQFGRPRILSLIHNS